MRTAWGYDVSSLSPIISVAQFNTITNNKYYGDPRIETAIKAASQAIRNYCGWHVSPSLTCTANPAGGAAVTRLPAAYVSGITSVKESSVTVDSSEYEWRKDGLLKRVHSCWPSKYDSIEVVYTAGYDADAVPDLLDAVCSIVTGVLAVSAGVTAESADGVSISYSANASSIAAALTSSQKAALTAYKAVASHAA